MGAIDLQLVWFGLIAVLWIGYFFLEGFDFGVGILLPVLGESDDDRRLLINAVGPHWDGNEVWLLTAGGAMFAAFPEWYATLFSGFYLPLLLILVALIVRGVAFEFRHHRDDAAWKRRWDRAIFGGSLVPALLWGVAFANLVRGVPIRDRQFVGSLLDLLNPYALFGGLTMLAVFTLHGAVFAAMKVDGPVARRAEVLAGRLGLVSAAAVFGFLGWTYLEVRSAADAGIVPGVIPITAVLAAVAVEWLVRERQFGWAFAANGLAIVLITATVFLRLYPRVMISSLGPAQDLTIAAAASTDRTLTLMTIAAVVMTPIIIAYQGWTYWVFRERVRQDRLTGPERTPLDLLEETFRPTGEDEPVAGV